MVFIGHVDAGKSTLSGNILYLTDFVDKRTIERYEREAKQRNRESWFLAYIMDTNEEVRLVTMLCAIGRMFDDVGGVVCVNLCIHARVCVSLKGSSVRPSSASASHGLYIKDLIHPCVIERFEAK